MKILAVDDEPLALELLDAVLGGRGYHVVRASSGVEALTATASERFDVVVLDRMMPGMDGLEVLRSLKARPALRWVPVILQTAMVGAEQMAEGIRAGAHAYLTKPYAPEVLLAMVEAAARDSTQLAELRARVAATEHSARLVRTLALELRTPEDVEAAVPFLAACFPDPARSLTGLNELMLNAIEHGNLELTYDDKSRLLAEGRWEETIRSRLEEPRLAPRRARVRLEHRDRDVVLEVEDEGPGFQWQQYLELDPARLTHAHGRGIAMARLLSFDALEYRGRGNLVEARVRGA